MVRRGGCVLLTVRSVIVTTSILVLLITVVIIRSRLYDLEPVQVSGSTVVGVVRFRANYGVLDRVRDYLIGRTDWLIASVRLSTILIAHFLKLVLRMLHVRTEQRP